MTMDFDHGGKIVRMSEQRVPAGEFKARCLALLDDVAAHRTEIVVTKYGRPVARVVPVDAPSSTDGSVSLLADDDDVYYSAGESWDAER